MRCTASTTSAIRRSPGAVPAEERAINTTSTPDNASRGRRRACPWRRSPSRSARLTRLRTTALPTFRLTVSPNRAGSDGPGSQEATKYRNSTRRPPRCTRINSGRVRNRWDLGKLSQLEAEGFRSRSSALLACGGDRELSPALAAPCLDHCPTRGGLHPRAEAMGATTLQVARLVSTLHPDLRILWGFPVPRTPSGAVRTLGRYRWPPPRSSGRTETSAKDRTASERRQCDVSDPPLMRSGTIG